MSHLSLVKPLSHLKEEQRFIDEIEVEGFGSSLVRGSVAEITGHASSGKASFALSVLAKLTAVGEICAVVDASGSFDPPSAVLAGVEIDNLLWVRCGGDVERSFISTDYLVQAKGFGAIWLDLAGLPKDKLRMVPKTYWFRYRTRIKETPTMLLVTSSEPVTGSASQTAFDLNRDATHWSGGGQFKLLRSFDLKINARKGSSSPPLKTRIEMDYTDLADAGGGGLVKQNA